MFSSLCRKSFVVFAGVTVACLATQTTFAAVINDPVLPPQMDVGPRAPLSAITYSADGKTLISVATDGEIRWRDIQTGKTTAKMFLPSQMSWIEVTPDGSIFTRDKESILYHWAAPTASEPLKLKHQFEIPERILQSAVPASTQPTPNSSTPQQSRLTLEQSLLSPDGKTLALLYKEELFVDQASERKARISLRNANTGALIRELPPISYSLTRPVLGFANTGKILLIAMPDHSVQQQSIAGDEVVKNWSPPDSAIQSPEDGAAEEARRLESMPSGSREGRRRPPSRLDGIIQNLQSPEKKFGTPLLFSTDGKLLLSLTLAGYKVWDLAASTARVLEDSIKINPAFPAFSPDGSIVTLRNSTGFWVWDNNAKKKGFDTVRLATFNDLDFSPDGRSVAMSDADGHVRFWNVAESGHPKLLKTLPGYVSSPRFLGITTDGVLAGSEHLLLHIPPGKTKTPTWMTQPAMEMPEVLPTWIRQINEQIVVSPDGTLIAETVALSPYASSLESKGFSRSEVRVRDAKNGAILWRIADNDRYGNALLAWLPDNSLLTGKKGSGRSARGLSDSASLHGWQRFNGKTGEEQSIQVNWENKVGLREPGSIDMLVTSSVAMRSALINGYNLQIIDHEAGKVLRARDQLRSREYSFTMSPDGRWLAAGHNTGSIILWDANLTTKSVHAPADITILPTSPKNIRVGALAFDKQGTLAAGLSDGRILVWKQPFAKGAAPVWETSGGSEVTSLTFDQSDNLWIGNARGELHHRNAAGELQSVLGLMPPILPTTNSPLPKTSPPGWIRWNKNGPIEKSP